MNSKAFSRNSGDTSSAIFVGEPWGWRTPAFLRRSANSRIGRFLLYLVVGLVFPSHGALADDEHVWAALKEGGKVILLRHAHVVMQEGIGRLSPGNCAAEVNLSPRGVDQAKRLGEAFRVHGVAVGEVLSSPYCRCLDTGKLAFGRATPVPFLKPPGVVSEQEAAKNDEQVLQAIRNHRGPSNLVIITHDLNIANVVMDTTIAMGQFVVLEPHGSDFKVIGEIRQFAQ